MIGCVLGCVSGGWVSGGWVGWWLDCWAVGC